MSQTKRYLSDCSGGGEHFGAPALAAFVIDRKTANFIVQMARLVSEHNIAKIEQYDSRAVYFEEDPRDDLTDDEIAAMEADPASFEPDSNNENIMRCEIDRISIRADEFRFLTYRKHCNDEIETEGQSIAELAAFFGISWDFGRRDKHLEAKFGADGEDDRYPRSDWRYEVAQNDTKLGYFEWLWHRYESDEITFPLSSMGPAETTEHFLSGFKKNGLAPSELDELVDDYKSEERADINNGGLAAQVAYLVSMGAFAELDALLP
jgi:hypothetical protein